MAEDDLQVPLEIQKLALAARFNRASDIVSVTSCNNHSCGGTSVQDAENLGSTLRAE